MVFTQNSIYHVRTEMRQSLDKVLSLPTAEVFDKKDVIYVELVLN